MDVTDPQQNPAGTPETQNQPGPSNAAMPEPAPQAASTPAPAEPSAATAEVPQPPVITPQSAVLAATATVAAATTETPATPSAATTSASATTAPVPAKQPPVLIVPKKHVSIPLAAASIALFVLAIVAFQRDLSFTHKVASGQAKIHQIADEQIAIVSDPSKGWFPSPRDPIFSWEQDEQGWQFESEGPAGLPYSKKGSNAAEKEPASTEKQHLKIVESGDAERGGVLAVPVRFPDPATIIREASLGPGDPYKLQGIRFIAYDVFVPKDCPGFVGCLLFLKDKDGLWFQARTRAALVPGAWSTVTADIRGDSPDVTPLGHLGNWDDNQATKVRTIGITFYGDKPYSGHVRVDNLRGWMRPQRFNQIVTSLVSGPQTVAPARARELQELAKTAETIKEEAVRVTNLRTDPMAPPADLGVPSSPPIVRKSETFTLRFELNRQIDNPFDPEKADVTCIVKAPSGKLYEHIGFWYQDYDRSDRFTEEELKPMGRPEWRVRITPREEGEYSYKLRVKLKNEPLLELPARNFMALPSNIKGFIRVSEADSRYFEFENGDFFYPVGHNVSTPVDIRCWKTVFNEEPPAGRGLPMYMDFFKKMEKNGENTVEVWMASWWLGIEWTGRWRDYYGATRYSLQHAWKLDYLLDLARRHGLYVHLVLDNHGKFSGWCDWEWDNNPYNMQSIGDTGVAANAEEFFTNETARKWHRNKLRYIAARWGNDPTVMGWELVSEYDLVGGLHQRDQRARREFHKSPILKAWAREMIGHLRQCDVYDHPVTNHYATDYQWVDLALAKELVPAAEGETKPKPLFDYVVTDVYRNVAKSYMRAAVENQDWFNVNLRAEAKKPFWITEYGGDFNAAPPAYLHADVHAGMWSTWMTEGAGTPLFWWYDLIDRNNYYTYYRAFSNYVKGEDRRGLNGKTAPLPISVGNAGEALGGYTYKWAKGAYGWAYSEATIKVMPNNPTERPKYTGVEATMTELHPGKYVVEFWDCFDGSVAKSETIDVAAGSPVRLKFPPFACAMAFKIKSVDPAK